jgi:hypothetical protein
MHMTGSRAGIEEIMPVKKSVTVANGQKLTAMWRGTAKIAGIDVRDVYVVPGLQLSLVSVGQLVEAGWRVRFDGTGAEISYKDASYHIKRQNELFSLQNCRRQNESNLNRQLDVGSEKTAETENDEKKAKSLLRISENLMYIRMGHVNNNYLHLLLKAVKDGFQLV